MPITVKSVTADELKAVALPSHGGKYATVSHGFIIDTVEQELNNAGYTVTNVEYKSNLNGEVALGIYNIASSDDDPDLDLMFAWANSYDKSLRFRCSVGATVKVCMNGMIKGDVADYGRKHVGDAKDEVKSHIKGQIGDAVKYFNQLKNTKDRMKDVTLTELQIGGALGHLYMDEVLTVTQIVKLKDELSKPSYDYGTPVDSLWTVYNCFTSVLSKSHPKKWIEDQKAVFAYFDQFIPKAKTEFKDPDQLDLVEEAEKAEMSTEAASVDIYAPEYAEMRAIVDGMTLDEITEAYADILSPAQFEAIKAYKQGPVIESSGFVVLDLGKTKAYDPEKAVDTEAIAKEMLAADSSLTDQTEEPKEEKEEVLDFDTYLGTEEKEVLESEPSDIEDQEEEEVEDIAEDIEDDIVDLTEAELLEVKEKEEEEVAVCPVPEPKSEMEAIISSEMTAAKDELLCEEVKDAVDELPTEETEHVTEPVFSFDDESKSEEGKTELPDFDF